MTREELTRIRQCLEALQHKSKTEPMYRMASSAIEIIDRELKLKGIEGEYHVSGEAQYAFTIHRGDSKAVVVLTKEQSGSIKEILDK